MGRKAKSHRTGDTEHLLGLVGSRAHESRSPVPFCFAQKKAVGVIVESPALRDGPPLGTNRGHRVEKRRRWKGRKRSDSG